MTATPNTPLRTTALRVFGASLTLACALLLGAAPAQADVRILPLGDSITEGTTNFPFDGSALPESAYRNASGGPPNNLRSYREHLHDLLNDSSCNADVTWVGSRSENGRTPAIHGGQSGERIDNLLNKTWSDQTGLYGGGRRSLDQWFPLLDPDVFLVHLGTNDIGQGQSVNNADNDLSTLLDRIYAYDSNAKVLLANLIPITGWYGDHRYGSPYSAQPIFERASQLTGRIGNLVAQSQTNGRDVTLVDVNSGFYANENRPVSCPAGTGGDSNNMSLGVCVAQPGNSNASIADGIHPTLKGDRHIAEQFFAALQNELNICGGGGGPDTQAPIAEIDTPSGDGQTFGANPTFDGDATDAGGLGFDRVRIVVRDNDASPARWLNFSTGQFELKSGDLPDRDATLSNTSTGTTDWSVDIPLSATGDYQLFALAYDNAGNIRENGQGQKIWTTRQFFIGGVPTITSPNPGTTLSGATQAFSWQSGSIVAEWWLYLGSSAGARDLYDSGNLGGAQGVTATGIATDGRTVHATLFYRASSTVPWQSIRKTYTAADLVPPRFDGPEPGDTFVGSTQSFSWVPNDASVQAWWLYLGTGTSGAAASNLYNASQGSNRTVSVSGLPTNGSTVYATLWYQVGGTWLSSTESFTAASGNGGAPPAATALTPSGSGNGANPTYTWSSVAGASWYRLWVARDSGGTPYTQWFNTAQAACGPSTCSVTPSHTVSDASTWWVQTWNDTAFGPWSGGRGFTP